MKFRKITAILAAVAALTTLFFTGSAAYAAGDEIVLAIDPGHGGSQPGTSLNGVGEKEYTLRLALLLKKKLEAKGGFKVCLTRTGDTTMEVYERGVFANSVNADALISLHFDGSASASDNGVTVYTSVIESCAMTSLSSSVAAALSGATGMADNGVRRRSDTNGYYWNFQRQWDIKDPSLGTLSDYYGIPTWGAKFGIPSMIIEHGYFTNAGDRAILLRNDTLEKMAQAEADTLAKYYLGHTHTYSAARTDYPSNCVYIGKQSEHCTVCNHRRNVTQIALAPDNHYWVQTSYVPAKCGSDGAVTYTCRITGNLIDKGAKIQNHTKKDIISAPAQHSFRKTERVDATHTVDGYVTYRCSNCQSSFKDILKAEGHTWEYVSYTAPTCTESGKRQASCSVCGYVLVRELSPLGHDESACQRTEPSCTENGSVRGTCARCGEDIKRELSASGHSFEEAAAKKPTCTEAGEVRRVCKKCGEEEANALPPAGHSYLPTYYLSPSCTEEGKAELVCSGCGAVFSAAVPASGHSFNSSETVKRAGLFTAGISRLTCSDCGATKEVKTASLLPFAVLPLGIWALLSLAAAILALIYAAKKKRADGTVTSLGAAVLIDGEISEILKAEEAENAPLPAQSDSDMKDAGGENAEKAALCEKDISYALTK